MENSGSKRSVDVVVVGAGIAGLYAALLLKRKGLSVLVLEDLDRIGGRITKSKGVDLGAQWFGPQHQLFITLLKEFGLSSYRQASEGKALLQLREQFTSYDCSLTRIDTFGEGKLRELSFIVKRIDEITQNFDTMDIETAKRMQSMSLLDWVKEQIESQLVGELFTTIIKTIFPEELDRINLFQFFYVLRSGGGYRSLVFTEGGAQESKVSGGAHQLPHLLAKELESSILFQRKVVQISQTSEEVEVIANISLGSSETNMESFTCQKCIVAVSLVHLSHIVFTPDLPTRIPSCRMGKVIKWVIQYRKSFWREKGLSGESMSDDFPLSFTFEYSPNLLVAYAVADNVTRLEDVSIQERQALVLDHLARLFGEELREAVNFEEKIWSGSQGGYFSIFPPSEWEDPSTLGKVWQRIHFAGTEMSGRWNGYMEGALQSSKEVVSEVLSHFEK